MTRSRIRVTRQYNAVDRSQGIKFLTASGDRERTGSESVTSARTVDLEFAFL
jgi:hypothetical protein